MRFHLRACALVIAGLLPASCAAGAPVIAGEGDAGREIVLAVGDALHVRLEARPGTGYRWEASGADPLVLAPSGGVVFEDPPDARPGGAQIQVLRFRAVGPGAVELALAYVRPWERGAAPARKIVLRVRVR